MITLIHEEACSAERAYPLYNLEAVNNSHYCLTMALAGFSAGDLSVTQQGSSLVISGHVKDKGEGRVWLHRGIATRAFERRFRIQQGADVQRAVFENGMLCIVISVKADTHRFPQESNTARLPATEGSSPLYFC